MPAPKKSARKAAASPRSAKGGASQGVGAGARKARRSEVPASPTTGEALRGLRQVSEALAYVQQSLADTVLKLPRPEDFEPLVAPLREFARVSPALVEAFRGVIQTTRALIPAPPAGAPEASRAAGIDAGRIEEARSCVDAARTALRQALGELPREADYARVAAQLRELATVSPSLMDWLKEVPRLTTPLAASIEALRRAAEELEVARDLLTEDASAPAPTPTPR